ncbi:class I SAM-dependent methyltransferase [Streptomyces sp. NPDC004126]|uniref:class I SAM-dependent methyltransferase n=1 Tax=Streptomyces sp. NPDC004126 TaxID=3390695 RepID=UPI003D02D8D8
MNRRTDTTQQTEHTGRAFTPALGRFAPTRFYDPVIALTRERLWRALTAAHVAPRPDETVVDVGCGTGSLAVMLGLIEPRARIVGVDPDPAVLETARRKAEAAGAAPVWRLGMGDGLTELLGARTADTVVSSLVLHQCPVETKRAVLASMAGVLRPGGRLVIADYGLQRTRAMRLAFRTVQWADGREDTRPNAEGVLPAMIRDAGFREVREAEVVPTATGSISVYVGRRG